MLPSKRVPRQNLSHQIPEASRDSLFGDTAGSQYGLFRFGHSYETRFETDVDAVIIDDRTPERF